MRNFKHFMDCWDYSTDELRALVQLIIQLKEAAKRGRCPKLLDGQSLGMIFKGNSTRTRVSFEVAATQLGGHALYLTGGEGGELHLGKRETIGDTARVVSSMVDGIAMRWRPQRELEDFASQCAVPFFNGMDDARHPTQTLCDLVTIVENLPEGKELKDITLTFLGMSIVRESSANDLAKLLPRFGADVVICSPDKYGLGQEYDPDSTERVLLTRTRRAQACNEGGGHIYEVSVPAEAIAEADYLYTGCVCYEGTETKAHFDKYYTDFTKTGYHVRKELIDSRTGIMTMHYLPALRGKEMDDYSMDFEGSLLWKQAENRLHTQRGLMAYLMGPLATSFREASKTPEEELAKETIKKMREQFGTGYTHY